MVWEDIRARLRTAPYERVADLLWFPTEGVFYDSRWLRGATRRLTARELEYGYRVAATCGLLEGEWSAAFRARLEIVQVGAVEGEG